MKDAIDHGRYTQQGIEPLDRVLHIRTTAAERAHIEQQAEAAGLSLSAYIRRCAAHRKITSRTDDAMIRELRRIGGLLKLLHIESGGAYSAATAAGLDSIRAAIDAVARAGRAAP